MSWRGAVRFLLDSLAWFYLLVAFLFYVADEPHAVILIVLALLPIGYLVWRRYEQALGQIDKRIANGLGRPLLSRLRVHSKDLPAYRFVDLYRATSEVCERAGATTVVESEHAEDLNSILHGNAYATVLMRRIKVPGHFSWPVGPGSEAFFPVDRFWLRPVSSSGPRPMVVRLRYQPLVERVALEVASDDADVAESVIREIMNLGSRQSIYRNRVLAMGFEAAVRDDFGDFEKPERMLVHFKADDPVTDEDIVLDDSIEEVLQRNVLDLQANRDVLKAHGVPTRRGVLFYGPPGTGKTYACRYLYGRLPGTTTIVVTGTSLLHVKSIFSFARMMQPSLLILEDVDLVFQTREVNLYSSVLGDLLDQMDGLRPEEDIGFILTTNAIERLEAAIKDRPGRISQCIRFGAPASELRRRYLLHRLRHYELSGVDLEHLIHSSQGATQAFIKEWVYRAAQFAVERMKDSNGDFELRTDDFDRALEEIRRDAHASAGKIVGFE